MLKLLRIKNIAVVAGLELELGPGLTLLTGETGAGKSILVDALGLLLGARAGAELIRTGEDQATVEAVVEVREAAAWLDAHGLPTDGDELVLRREIQASGRGRVTINGALAPLSVLRGLAGRIGAIHGQHEPQGLLDPATHVDVLDQHAGLAGEAAALAEPHRRLRAAEAALESFRRDRREGERRRETLEYQCAEIDRARLRPGEDESLQQEKVVQANAGRLSALAGEAYVLLYEDEASVVARLKQVTRRIHELHAIDARFTPYLEGQDAIRAQLDDLALFVRDYREGLHVAPGRLDEIESRLALLERLKRKYGATLEDVVAFGERCRAELAELGSPEEHERRLEAERTDAAGRYLTAAGALSRKRRRAARELEKDVESELKLLAMERTRFRVHIDPERLPDGSADTAGWNENGFDNVELLLSPNPGEELRPLARIASGGELSRILLALKSVASVAAEGQTLVFDEVDAGIGGGVAEIVGRKLRAIAARNQVLCVTHLPQIAALADRHFVVRKHVDRGRTLAEVSELGAAERVEEVARMLGGETVTDAARRHAREMVKHGMSD
jgi:DNA repair protein RecN (Recombination protein N)